MVTDDCERGFQAALAVHRAGRLEEAAAGYHRLLDAHPQYVPARVNLGQIYRRMGKTAEAIACYLRALDLGAGGAAVYFNLANARRDAGHWTGALEAYDHALHLAPDMVQAHCGRGIVLRRLGHRDEALAALNEAVRLNDGLWRAWSEIGEIRCAAGSREEGAVALKRGLALNPGSLTLMTRVAELDWGAGRHADAIAALRRAVALNPRRADVHINLAVCLSEAWQLGEALAMCNQALTLEPESHGALLTAGKVQVYRGEIAGGIDCVERALAVKDTEEARRSRAFACLYDDRLSAERTADIQRESVRGWPGALAAGHGSTRKRRAGKDRLTLVYLSPDLHGDHPVAQFMAPMLAAHDRQRFRIAVMHAHPGEDDISRQLAADVDQWVNISAMDDNQTAQAIRELEADVLIDLAGHTAHSRLKVLGLRPAPVQASFLGFPFTTGFAAVDYLVADPVVCPPEREDLYHEKLLRLPRCVFCLPELGELPPAAHRPGIGGVVFGNFGNLAKLSNSCLGMWVRVLRAVPDSRLMLKAGGLADEDTRRCITDRLAALGIPAGRLILRGPSPFREMLDQYRDVDIILDTRPYNGGTTTFHALAMGVPLVTLPGEAFYGRMGASILTTLGRPEWIAGNEEHFVSIAVDLAADVVTLRTKRSGLRQQLHSSPLGDHAGYVKAFEGLLDELFIDR